VLENFWESNNSKYVPCLVVKLSNLYAMVGLLTKILIDGIKFLVLQVQKEGGRGVWSTIVYSEDC
jgi:hypothetical protein